MSWGLLEGMSASKNAGSPLLTSEPKLAAAWYNRGFLRMKQEDWPVGGRGFFNWFKDCSKMPSNQIEPRKPEK